MDRNKNWNPMRSISLWMLIAFVGCKDTPKNEQQTTIATDNVEVEAAPTPMKPKDVPTVDITNIPSSWQPITTQNDGILLDIKYATTDNFTKKQIYDCPACFLRPEAAVIIKRIHNELKDKYGYGLKVFDCFRPQPYQQRLWDIVPNPSYVTPPNKGSMHSRGLAIDLTIVDANGNDLDMGTAYDYFGKEAHHDYTGLDPKVQKNRDLLKGIMESHGFASIRTEWWHYSLHAISYPLDSWVWNCK
jgi:zinc D-Ala-D-Ala dipeptidase